MNKESFSEKVVKAAQSIPAGRVATYGDLARACGAGLLASRSITGILSKAHKNGITDIPFHRIVYANGKVWINEKHRKKRMRLYEEEGILLDSRDQITNFDEIRL